MDAVRWDEFATLTRTSKRWDKDEPPRELVAEGSLAEIVDLVSRIDMVARIDLLISLPDRHAPPTSYEPGAFIELLFRKDRPKTR